MILSLSSLDGKKFSRPLSCFRFLCQRSIPVENTLLWSSTLNSTPVMVTQIGTQVRDFTLEAAWVAVCCTISPWKFLYYDNKRPKRNTFWFHLMDGKHLNISLTYSLSHFRGRQIVQKRRLLDHFQETFHTRHPR